MTTRTVLTGVLTAVLLSLIVLVLYTIRTDRTHTALAQTVGRSASHTASLQHLTLGEMIDRSGVIFRGRVLDFQPGTVEVGGGTLPTVTYHIRVEEAFKGDFPTKENGESVAEITMLGSIKNTPASGKLSTLPAPPQLTVGGDYLLILTAESEVGLSSPVGLGQGAFSIYEQDKQEWAKNEFDNAGIFDGAVRYPELAQQIREKGGKK